MAQDPIPAPDNATPLNVNPAMGQDAPQVASPAPTAPLPQNAAPVNVRQQPSAPAPDVKQMAPAQPAAGKFFATLSHAFLGAALKAGSELSGGDTVTTGYDPSRTDPQTGGPLRLTRPATGRDHIGNVVKYALRGLEAAALTPVVGPAAPMIVANEARQQNAAKLNLANEQFKQQQDVLIHRAEIARSNALTSQVYLGNLKTTNDLDPTHAEYSTLIDAARKSPDLADHVKEITGTELKDLVAKDHNYTSSNIVRPLGLAPTMGEDGPLMHDDGITPMQHMRYGVIEGLPAKDGKLVVTPELESHIEEYGNKLTGTLPKVGDTIPLDKYIYLSNALDTEKLNRMQGWQQSTVGTTDDGKTPLEINSYTKETRPLKTITADNAEKLAKGTLTKAQADEAEGKASEARANAAAMMNGAGAGNDPNLWRQLPEVQQALANMPPAAQSIMKTINPANIKPLMLVANGDAKLNDEFPANPRKGSPIISASQASSYLQFFNPNYSEHFYDDVKNVRKDFSGSGPQTAGGAISSFNNFLNHSAEVLDASAQLKRNNSPWLAKPLNEIQSKGLGVPEVGNLNTAIMAARSEWQTFIHNGHVPTAEESAAGATLMNDASTPEMIAGALGVMGKQAVGRLDSINEKWRTVTGTDYPNLITPMGRASAQKLGLDVSAYKSGGNVQGVNPQNVQAAPPPAAQVFNVQAWQAKNPNGDVNAAIAAAKQKGYTVKQ